RAVEGLRSEMGATAPVVLAKCVVPFLLLMAVEQPASGEGVMTVDRKAGAEGCPDVDALTSRVERIRGRAADHVKVGYQVTFARRAGGFQATIRSNPEGTGVRTLEDHGTTCAALAQATAVTLALLIDSDATPSEPESTPPPPPKPSPTPAPVPAPTPT